MARGWCVLCRALRWAVADHAPDGAQIPRLQRVAAVADSNRGDLRREDTAMLASLIQDGLSAVTARDTVAAMAAVHAAEDALPHGPHPLRRYLRAAECAVDIAQWDQAAGHLRGAVAVAVHPAVGLPLAS